MSEQFLAFRRSIQLLLLFAVAFSLISLPGPLSSLVRFPSVSTVHASATQATSDAAWLPAGPSTNTELVSIFTNPNTELTSGLLANTIDFGDWPVVPSDITSMQSSSNSYFLSIPHGDHFYRELEFNMANSFWGCSMNYGNSACGLEIRQAIAHLLNRPSFATSGPCAQQCLALNNPVPQPIDPNTPISCGWDTTYPGSSTTNCKVGYSANSLTAYDCVASGASCPTGSGGGTCGGTCYRPWMRVLGSADFCAAANLLKTALGGSTTVSSVDCVLSNYPSTVSSDGVNIYARQDPGRNDVGVGLSEELCALFGKGYVEGCTSTGGPNIVSVVTPRPAGTIVSIQIGPINLFPGFNTCLTVGTTAPCTPPTGDATNSWWMYTAGFRTGTPYDFTYGGYNSQFTSAPTGNTPSPCASTNSTDAAGAYQNYCSQKFDSYVYQLENAQCSTGAGADPLLGQDSAHLSFGACASTNDFVLSAGTAIINSCISAVTGTTACNAAGGQTFTVPISVTSVGTVAATTVTFSTTAVSPSGQGVTATTPAAVSLSAANPSAGTGGDQSLVSNLAITVAATATLGTTFTVTVASGAKSIAISVSISANPSGNHFATLTSVGATRLSALTAQYLLQDQFGRDVATVPVFSGITQIAWVSPSAGTACATTGSTCDSQGWTRVVNGQVASINDFYTFLNTWNACPVGGGTPCAPGSVFRQGFSQTSTSLNPYKSSTVWDFFIAGNVYDSIYGVIPYAATVTYDYMTVSHCFTQTGSTTCPPPSYTPPTGTTQTIHNVLRNDIFWQDGTQVTAWDVAFMYASCIANGAFQCGGLSSIISGITVLSNTQFDINLFGRGPFTETSVGGVAIIPGHLWSNCASTWSSVTAGATPATITSTTGGCFNTPSSMANLTFDPLAAGILVGSGAFECQNTTTGVLGGGCSNSNTQSPTKSFTLTRFGCQIGAACVPPASSPSSLYFRSSSNLALYIWSGMTGNPTADFANLSTAVGCAQPAGTTFSASAACSRWQQGIGNPSGDGVACCIVGSTQLSVYRRFYTVDWTSPFAFPPTTLTMPGIDTFPPVLYEGAITLNPSGTTGIPACSTAGNTFNSGAGYNC